MFRIFDDYMTDGWIDELVSFPFELGKKILTSTMNIGRMPTDIREFSDRYELAIELPGFSKDEVKIELKDNYLIVSAEKQEEQTVESKAAVPESAVEEAVSETEAPKTDEKTGGRELEGRYIRRERFIGKGIRNYYVGEFVKGDQITAKFQDGILMITVPKIDPTKKDEEKVFINIG